MVRRILLLAALVVVAAVIAGIAYSAGGGTIAQAQAQGWDCHPLVPIGGYFHCAPPGKPSVLDMVLGQTNAPTLELRVFNPDGSFAGIESLLRADLYQGQPCPQDNLAEWTLLDLPIDYRACHHFDT
jgi:hypothetical protein